MLLAGPSQASGQDQRSGNNEWTGWLASWPAGRGQFACKTHGPAGLAGAKFYSRERETKAKLMSATQTITFAFSHTQLPELPSPFLPSFLLRVRTSTYSLRWAFLGEKRKEGRKEGVFLPRHFRARRRRHREIEAGRQAGGWAHWHVASYMKDSTSISHE